jgi:hypothetical protein
MNFTRPHNGTAVAPAGAPITRRLIPFEQSFEFQLLGQNRVQKQTVVVSVEAAFTATSIGYGFVADVQALTFGPTIAEIFPRVIFAAGAGGETASLDEIPFSALLASADRALSSRPEFGRKRPAGEAAARIGIQLNPDLANAAVQGTQLNERALSRLFRVVDSEAREVLFRYALFDEGTGRAFQSEPILNIAGLGTSNGDRPFRHFAPPIWFAPKTTIGLEITEVSNHIGGLFISLQGYKVLGGDGTPTAGRQPERRGRR